MKFPKINSIFTQISILTIVIFAVYFQSLDFGFVNLDDDIKIQQNYEKLKNPELFKTVFTTDSYFQEGGYYYRPTLTLSIIFDAYLWQLNPFGYHLTNLLLHLISSILFLILLRKLNLDIKLSFLFVVLYAVIPLSINAVVWIPGRNDLIASIFIFLSLLMFLNYNKSFKIVFFVLHLVFLFMAFISKEQALVLPVLILTYIYLFEDRNKKKLLLLAISWIPVYLIYFFLRNIAVKSLESNPNIFSSFLFNLQYIPEILSKAFFPYGLSGLPEYNIFHFIIGICLIALLIIVIFKKRRQDKFRIILFGALWFLLFTIPALFSNPGLARFDYLECRAYVPFAGIIIVFISLISQNKNQKYLSYLLLVLIIIYSGLNISLSKPYKDALSFYDNIIENNPNSALAFNNRGLIYKHLGDFNKSLSDYNSAISINQEFPDAYFNLGSLYELAGKNQDALTALNKGLELRENATNAYYMRANIRLKLLDTIGAYQDYGKVLNYDSTHQIALNSRGILYLQQGKFEQAIKDFTRAFKINPKYIKAIVNRGLAYMYLKNYTQALKDYNIAEKLDSKNSNIYFNRANCHYLLNDFNRACLDWYKAVSLGDYRAAKYISAYCK